MNQIINYKFDKPLHNEDAPAISNEKYLIVCDGLGAGGQNKHTINGETHSSAYFGSRLLSKICDGFYKENYDAIFDSIQNNENLSHIVSCLKTTIKAQLDEYVEQHKLVKTIKGKSIKMLPSTLSSMLFKENGDYIDVVVISAGDTRAFVLTAHSGLQQISKDDVDEDVDAFEKATIVNNNICQDRDFTLNFRCYKIKKPCILFVCSDGCYDYFSSPMEVEYIIEAVISKWFNSEKINSGNFGDILGDFIAKHSGLQDDCSMSGVFIGYQDEAVVRSEFFARAKDIETKFVRPFNTLDRESKQIDGKYDSKLVELKQKIQSCEKRINTSLSDRVKQIITNYLLEQQINDSDVDILNYILTDEKFNEFLKNLSDEETKKKEDKKQKQDEKDNIYKQLWDEFSKTFVLMNQRKSSYSNKSKGNWFYDPAADLYNEEQKYQKNYQTYTQRLRDFDDQLEYIKNATPQQIYDDKAVFELARRYQSFYNALNNLMYCEQRIRSLRPQVIVVEPIEIDENTVKEAFSDAWQKGFSEYRRIAEYQETCRLYDQYIALSAAADAIEPFGEKDKIDLFEAFYQENGQELLNKIIEKFGLNQICDSDLYDKLISYQKEYQNVEDESSKYVKQKHSLWLEYKEGYELFEKAILKGVV